MGALHRLKHILCKTSVRLVNSLKVLSILHLYCASVAVPTPNNALNSDFYAKYRRIEPEQATQIQESQMGFALTRFLYARGNVRSLVHCKI